MRDTIEVQLCPAAVSQGASVAPVELQDALTELDHAPSPTPNPFATLVLTLRQLTGVLRAVTNEQYVRKPVGVIASSLGGHVRHCLDHVETLLAGVAIGALNYDRRQRGTSVETSRIAALQAIRRLEQLATGFDDSVLMRPVRVITMLDADGATLAGQSSVARELAFVISHTIHHGALIDAMCRMLGVTLPERIGIAPATMAFLRGKSCAPSPSFD